MRKPIANGMAALLAGIAATHFAGQAMAQPADADAATLAKFEKDLAQAVVSNDISVIEPVCADDFYSFNSTTGHRGTKADLLADLRATDGIATEMKFPPFFVHIFGSTGFAQGTNEQVTLYKGKRIHGSYVWFDVFEKRNGRWVWIISESTEVNARITDKQMCKQPYCAPNQPGFTIKR